MLAIRSEQVLALSRGLWSSLEDDLLRRCARVGSPAEDADVDDGILRLVIRGAFARASERGLVRPGDVAVYAQAALDGGIGFATDPMHRWAARALDPRSPSEQRGRRLQRAMAIAAPALRSSEWRCAESVALHLTQSGFTDAPDPVPTDLPSTVLHRLGQNVRRVMGLPPHRAREIVRVAKTIAQRCGLADPLGTAVFLLPVVAFGHEYPVDPRYGWAAPSDGEAQGAARLRSIVERFCRYAATRGSVDGDTFEPRAERVLPDGRRLIAVNLESVLTTPQE